MFRIQRQRNERLYLQQYVLEKVDTRTPAANMQNLTK